MYPILGRYGPFFLYSFTVVLGAGIAAGIGLAVWQTHRRNVPDDWLDGILWALLVGLLGGRVGFVAGEWTYFQERPSEIAQLWRGGLSYHGALLAGLIGYWGWCRWRKRPFPQAAALLAPAFALSSAFGWFACWFEGCAYGREALPGSRLASALPDAFGVFTWRYQTQLLGVGFALVVFLIALHWQRRNFSPMVFWFVLGTLSLGRAAITLLRGDPAPLWGQIRIDTILDGMLAILFLILLQYQRKRQ
jgi:phosphatidylglycerol:prolipoprotein diacylglycerol transferase